MANKRMASLPIPVAPRCPCRYIDLHGHWRTCGNKATYKLAVRESSGIRIRLCRKHAAAYNAAKDDARSKGLDYEITVLKREFGIQLKLVPE